MEKVLATINGQEKVDKNIQKQEVLKRKADQIMDVMKKTFIKILNKKE